MLGMVVPWGEERSIMIHDFFQTFCVAMLIGPIQ